MSLKTVTVWVCPHPECGNYYGASGDVDLTASANRESDLSHTVDSNPARPVVTSNRGECPDCRPAGRRNEDGSRIQRLPMSFVPGLHGPRPRMEDQPTVPAHARSTVG